MLASQVSRSCSGVGGDLVGGSGGDRHADVEHHDTACNGADEAEIVLHEQDREAARPQRLDRLREPRQLAVTGSCRELVDEEDARAGRDRGGQHQDAAIERRKLARGPIPHIGETELVERRECVGAGGGGLGARERSRSRVADEPSVASAHRGTDEHVL